MDDVSGLSSDTPLKLWSDAQVRQPWDDDSGFWDDPDTLRAIEELTISEIKGPADAALRKRSDIISHTPTTPLRDSGNRSGGRYFSSSSPSSRIIVATLSQQSQPLQSQGIHASCQEVT